MQSDNFERQVAEVLDGFCGCPRPAWDGYGVVAVRLINCPKCRSKRIAAALLAVRNETVEQVRRGTFDGDVALAAGLAALKGEATDG
jgi:hypothetical protein